MPKAGAWPGTGTGSLSVMPVSLDLAGRFGDGPLSVNVSAGATLFNNSFEASSAISKGVSWYWISYINQAVDALAIPAEIPKTSWTAIGFNGGAGITFNFSPSLALLLDARYFFCPKKELDWTLVTGTYNGIFYTTITGQSFSASDASSALANMTTFQVNPSFIQITAGIKISI
jgi:opacity protein-like surface antigen